MAPSIAETSYDPSEVATLEATSILTGGLTFMLVSTILKLLGSVSTEAHEIVVSLLRSMIERSAGAVT